MSSDEKDNLEESPKSDKAAEPVKCSTHDLEFWKFIITICSLVIAFLGVIIAGTVGYFNIIDKLRVVKDDVGVVNSRVEKVEINSLRDQFVIVSPGDGAFVDLNDIIRGKTPYPERKHYIVVTPVKNNSDWVQKNPITPDPTGSWAGSAEFGSGDAGIGEKFLVSVLATSGTIPPGQLTSVPPDAVRSASITVTRKK